MGDIKFARLTGRRSRLYSLVDKVKLWPSRTGVLHGVRAVRLEGDWLTVETHCGEEFRVRNSSSGRGKRHIKHGHYRSVCKRCGIPDWKIEKFNKSTN